MKLHKIKPGTIIQHPSGDRFCVLLADDREVWMHRIHPAPSEGAFYSRHVSMEDFERHGYSIVKNRQSR